MGTPEPRGHVNLPALLDVLPPGGSLTVLPEQLMGALHEPDLGAALRKALDQGERSGCHVLFGYADATFVRFTKRREIRWSA
jgi:hypothetical protein